MVTNDNSQQSTVNSQQPTHFMGELAALSAAFVWALSSTIWQRVGQQIPAVVLNLLKGAIALFMLLATTLILGKSLPALNPHILAMLLISGALGIGIGDTAFFIVLKYLGASTSSIKCSLLLTSHN
ncbi:DMT family transporter [Microcoleus sp. MON1_C1]|uniref:DMT family transporter n=1 Tax=Microcoleus sp. MON1_C1 TaxID=2818827 RepID=UPI002FD4DE0F